MRLYAKKSNPLFKTTIFAFLPSLQLVVIKTYSLKLSHMDSVATKSEASLRRRNSFSTISDASSTIVKRRRRCPSMLALNDHKTNSEGNQIQTSTTPLVDQSSNTITTTTTTTPTTVKRSSKYRGVSRFGHLTYKVHLFMSCSYYFSHQFTLFYNYFFLKKVLSESSSNFVFIK